MKEVIINGVVIERSHRHIHLTEEAFTTLYGKNKEFRIGKALSVMGEFATDLEVNIPIIGKCKLLWPLRSYNQLELSMAEYIRLFNEIPKRRMSGDLDDTRKVHVSWGNASVEVNVIVPYPHIHGDIKSLDDFVYSLKHPLASLEYEFKPSQTIDSRLYMHLDNDSYNAVLGYGYEQ